MRNLFLMSLFGLFMIAAMNGETMVGISFISPAYASDNDDDNTSSTTSSDETEDDTASDETTGLNCPDGITSCYSADGSEYTDVNNLAATAAGLEGEDDDGGAIVSVVKPKHFRSF